MKAKITLFVDYPKKDIYGGDNTPAEVGETILAQLDDNSILLESKIVIENWKAGRAK